MKAIRHVLKPMRVLGALLVLFSAASLVITGYALFLSGAIADRVTLEVGQAISAITGLLDTSTLALEAAADGLAQSQDALFTINEALFSVYQAVTNTYTLLTEANELTSKTLPQVITATQQSLATAQETARSIEAVLGVVSQVPFFPGGAYEPAVPLQQALGNVATDLEGLRTPMTEITLSLDETQSNLGQVQEDILDIIIQLRILQDSLGAAAAVIAQYQSQLQAMYQNLQDFGAGFPTLVAAALWFARFLLGWVGIGQGALLLYGVRLIAQKNPPLILSGSEEGQHG